MNIKEFEQLSEIVKGNPWEARSALIRFLKNAKVVEEVKGKRTTAQNAALHLNFQMIADKLNDAGLDIRHTLKETVEVPWTAGSVKEVIWKPVMNLMYKKESTTELSKVEEIDKVHEVIMRELGKNHGIEWHDFPSSEALRAVQFEAVDNLKNAEYPVYTGEVKF